MVKKAKKLLALLLALGMVMSLVTVTTLAAEEHEHIWGEWEAPKNGMRNFCRRTCTVEGCGKTESHVTKGEWVVGEEGSARICTVCGAEETCDHSRGWGPWRADGENCVRKCLGCARTESHTSQWGEYVGPDKAQKHYCTGRYCTVDGCGLVNRINTVEELQEAIAAGLTELQIDAWEPFWNDPSDMTIQNSPITVTEDVTIDGGEAGITIKRLGYGYGGTKTPTFIVENGATLTLRNVTIQGGRGDMNGSCMIRVDSGTLVLDDGAVLTEGGSYGPCSGVYLNGGDLVMNEGSKITDTVSDSAVLVREGTFTMNGGTISGNTVSGVGSSGAIEVEGSDPGSARFIMNGGSISGNRDTQGYGMGTVMINCGTMTMGGGEITGNAGGGVTITEGSLAVTGGAITGNTGLLGGGVMAASALGGISGEPGVTASITISGGEIKDNDNTLLGPADVMIGFMDANITGGEIGTFCGNSELLKFMAILYGESADELTKEELLELGREMGYTDEQLAMKPKLTGGTFANDVSEYVAPGYQLSGNTVMAIPSAPAPVYYTLTINYVYADGSQAAARYRRSYESGSRYKVASPEIEGYTADLAVVSGRLNRRTAVTVTYTAVEEEVGDPNTPLAGALPFEDVAESDWFYGAVSSLYFRELMGGLSSTVFGPEQPCTRGTVATILHRMEKEPEATASDFTDVLAGAWYAPAVDWAREAGLMIGFGNGVFCPEAGITREQMALTMYRYAKFKGLPVEAKGDLSAFADAEQVSDWAREAMEWAVGCGIIKGTTENRLAPQGAAKRSELAAVVQGFLEAK